MINQAGFLDAELVAETGFDSSPVTRGMLIRATRTAAVLNGRIVNMQVDSIERYQEFFNLVYSQGTLDRKTKHLIALGASLGAGCQP